MRFAPAFLLGAVLALAGSVPAQEPAPLPALQSATCGWPPHQVDAGPEILTLIEQRMADATGYEAETLRDGFIQLRRWIHGCDETASRQAVLELQRAYDRSRSNPALQAALGVALARGIEVQPPGVHGYNYRPAYEQSNAEKQARRLLAEAIDDWPAPELGEEFAALALATRDGTTLDMAAEALASLTRSVPASATVWSARAEIAIARRQYDEALEAAANAAGLGDAAGQRALGVVRLRLDDDPAAGGTLYLEGLAAADEDALYRYHEDIAPLLSFAEEADWSAQSGAERKVWLRRKWEWRASNAARTVAERLAVHFERIETADHMYRRLSHRGARPVESIVWDSLQLRLRWDDRGLVFLRHGQPDDIVRVPIGIGGPGREAWIYWGLNGSRALFEFQKVKLWADWFAAPPATCDPFVYMYGVSGTAGEMKFMRSDPDTFPNWQAEFERGLFDYATSIGVVDPAAATNAFRCVTIARRGGLADELPYIRLTEASRRMDARADIAEALATETATPRFENFIPALSSVYAFRGDDASTVLAAFLMLPGENLTPRPVFGGVVYALRLTLAIEDPIAQRVQRRDTLLGYRAVERLVAGQRLRTAIEMPATAVTDATVRITVLNPDHPDEGQILVANRTVPAFSEGALSLSDLVIAEPGPGSWTRGAVAISPLPGHQLATDQPFRLFYEVYGLEPDESVRTRITVAPSLETDLLSRMRSLFGERRVLELSFEETARPQPGGMLQVDRTITASLEPGRYTLEVTVERPGTGESAASRTRILLVER